MKRIDGRQNDQLRRIKIYKDYLSHPLSSVMIEFGGTKVICAVSVEPKVPGWMKAQRVEGGWLTCEYSMIPASTHDRMKREITLGKPGGRTMEIQRLIGRSLRNVVNLAGLKNNTLYVDCEVIDADGGTRCSSICGASVALQLALNTPFAQRNFEPAVFREPVAAVSVGMFDGELLLDLCYEEDSRADVDLNVVMTESGKLVEIQGTAEHQAFSKAQFNAMLELAEHGIKQIFDLQRKVVSGSNELGNKTPGQPKKERRVAQINPLGEIFGEIKID